MTDRAFEPAGSNPFDQFDAGAEPAVGLPKGVHAQDEGVNPFDQFDPKPEVSSFGAFRRGVARSALPALVSIPAMGAGAELGAAVGAPLGPLGAAGGAVIGGIGGAIAGGMAGESAQRWALSKLPDSWTDALGMSDRQEKLDQEQAPKASFLGGLAPYALTMRPGGFAKKTLPENSTALERIMAHPATARVFGAGIMGGMELGQEAVQGESPDWAKVGIATGFGLVFNKPTRIGEAITEIGARPTRTVLGRPHPAPQAVPPPAETAAEAETPSPATAPPPPAAGIAPTLFHAPPRAEPTIAEADDLGIFDTKEVFEGSHQRNEEREAAAREARRTEISVIGPDPAPPDVHSVARQMHFDLFNEYDALRARRRALEGEPGAAAHLAETEAELARLEPEVQAANRRAAEAAGHPILEPEAPPTAPEASVEQQKATIAEDVTRQLMAAGRPQDEADAAGKLIAARYAARATRMQGALGTPEELYRREGAEIRGEQIRRKVASSPAAARSLDNFAQRMAEGREQAQRRRNEGGSAVQVITTAEKYAGVTKEEFEAAKHEAVEAAPDLKTALSEDDWEFLASPEFHQRKAEPRVSGRMAGVSYDLPQSQFERLQEARRAGAGADEIRRMVEDFKGQQSKGDLFSRIRDKYDALSDGGKRFRVLIADLHDALPDVSLPDLQRTLREMQANESEQTVLYRMDNQRELTDRDRATAIHFGQEPRHIVHMEPRLGDREFFQRKTAPSGPNLFTEREGDVKSSAIKPQEIGSMEEPKDGQPVVIKALHGSEAESIDEFDVGRLGSNFGDNASKEGFFFTENNKLAGHFGAHVHERYIALNNPKVVKVEDVLRDDYAIAEKHREFVGTFEEYVSDFLEGNPYAYYERGMLDADIADAKKAGHDGLILDFGGLKDGDYGKLGRAVVAFDAAQISKEPKSVPPTNRLARGVGGELSMQGQREAEGQTNLPGTERISEADLAKRRAAEPLKPGVAQKPMDFGLFGDEAKQGSLFQRGGDVQGGIRLNPGNVAGRDYIGVEGVRPIMRLMKYANASTFIHESGHQFLGELLRDAEHELAPDQVKTDAAAALNWLGVKSAEALETRHQEKFARGFEQYLREGVAPSPELASVFARFKQWLMNIYQTIKGLGKEISPDIRAVFDRMLSAEPRRTVIAPEREVRPTLQDIHEADAREIEPEQAHASADRVATEADQHYTENPHAPEFESAEAEQLAAETREAAQRGGEARPGGGEGGAVQPEAPEPQPGGGGAAGEHAPERPGGTNAPQEGDGARETEQPAGRERPESVPLAGRPTPDLTIGGQSFNVGKDGNVRAENISSREQFVAAINESSERIPGTGDRLTMGQMKGLADDLDIDPKNVDEAHLAATFGGLHNIASKIDVLRRTVLRQSETVFNLMRNVKDTNSDQAVAEFAAEAARLDMFMSVLSSVTTEMGRGLGMGFRNMEGWQKAADLNAFLKANTGKELFQLKMMAKLGSQLDTPAKVARFLRDSQNRSFGGMLLEYWINGLISGIATHTTYSVGGVILTAEKLGPETAAAAMIGAARKAMGREGETVRFGEVGAHFGGAIRGLPASLQAAAEGLRTGLTTLLPGEKARPLIPFTGDTGLVTARTIGNEPVSWGELGADIFGMVRGMRDGIVSGAALIKAGGEAGAPAIGFSYSALGQIPDIAIRGVPAIPIGSAIRVPGRFIAAIHSFFRTTNYSAYRAGGAYRAATQGAEEARAAGRQFDFDAEVANHWLNPSDAQMENYRHEATETSLMGHAGKFTENLQKLTNTEINLPVVGGIRLLKFVDPFVHISSNIIKQTVVERTPLGLLSSELRADLSGKNGTIAQDTATARMLVGSALSITFGGLAAEGLITGSGPSDPHEAAMWREVYQPHSVRIGDMWYQVNRLGPMGMLLGIAADLYEVAHDATEGDVLKAAAHLQHAFTQNILDESFMRGPADLIKAVEDPGRYGEGYIKNFFSSFVPFSVGMSQMARAADPYSRQARNVMDAIRAKVLGYSQALLPRRNIWGEEVPNLPALGGRAISALYEKQVNSDPVNQAMVDLGIHPAAVERKIRNVELTDQQYDDFARIAGRTAKQRLDMIVRAPDWQTWPNHIRHDVISEVIRQSREAARGMTMMRYPQIPRDAAEALRKKKMGEK